MKRNIFDSVFLNTSFRYIAPFILMHGVYVLFHGEYSPGGGFQAGGLLGIAVVLDRLIETRNAALYMSGKLAVVLAGIGAFIFIFTGILTMLFDGNFLEYAALPLAVSDVEKHIIGIMTIEVGVTLCVMATIIVIFDALTRRKD